MLTGVVDITGNAQSTFSAVSFTTGTGTDLVDLGGNRLSGTYITFTTH